MAELPSGTVTFLFSDLVSSTRLWEDQPDVMQGVMARHDEILRTAIVAEGGHVVKTTGDGVHAAFGTADAAVRCALTAQCALLREEWGKTGELRVRMGIHTGAAEQRDGDYYGTTLNRAARLMSVAHGGQVVVSLATEEVLGDSVDADIELVDLGAHRLRDVAMPLRVFQLAHPDLPREFPPLRSLDALRGNVPVPATSFVGRDGELAELCAAVGSGRLVTLVGVGGVGKTRLAIEAGAMLAPDLTDGVWFCELAAADDAESMYQLVAATLGVASRPGLGLGDSVVEFLGPKALLLVLDNCEHVIDTAAELAQLVVAKCPDVRVLSTSREPLALHGERVFPVGSLAMPNPGSEPSAWPSSASVRLFLERAADARPEYRGDHIDLGAIAELCRRLDGIPLALELAAARAASMTPGEIAAHLDERFRLLAGRRRGTIERHQTLRATLDWSYSLLDDTERRIFDRLGVFAGSFTADAAVAVAGDDLDSWDILDALSALATKSMLVADTTSDGVARYRMLETMRHYARERLATDDPDPENWWSRHAEYYASLAQKIGDALLGPDELAWRPRLAAELDDLRAAVNWSLDRPDDDRCLRIVAALSVQAVQYDTAGIGTWALQCETRAQDAPAGLRVAVLATAAWERYRTGDPEAAVASGLDALCDGLPQGWPSSYVPHLALTAAFSIQGRIEEADALAAEGHQALDAAGAPALGHTNLYAVRTAWSEDPREARELADAALANARSSGNPSTLAVGWFADSYSRSIEQPEEALAAMQEALTLVRHGAGDGVFPPGLALAAGLLSRLGDADQAMTLLREAVLFSRDTGNRVGVGTAIDFAVQVFADQGQYDIAATLAGTLEAPPGLVTAASPPEQDLRVEKIERADTVLGDAAFAAAFARGTAMSYNAAVDYLLDQINAPIPRGRRRMTDHQTHT